MSPWEEALPEKETEPNERNRERWIDPELNAKLTFDTFLWECASLE
jgi:hypothetical protein